MITDKSARYSCACPNGWDLQEDAHTCLPPQTTTAIEEASVVPTEKNEGPNSTGRGSKGAEAAGSLQDQNGIIAGIVAGGILGFAIVVFIVSIL